MANDSGAGVSGLLLFIADHALVLASTFATVSIVLGIAGVAMMLYRNDAFTPGQRRQTHYEPLLEETRNT